MDTPTDSVAAGTLEGRIERITFNGGDSHFMIARFRVAGQAGLVTVLGHMPEPRPGESLRLHGCWQHHPRYGQQFRVDSFEVLLPSGVDEIRHYLGSGLIEGVGPKLTERLIAHFQADTLSVIEREPQRLAEVRGIGPETARRIGEAWKTHHAVRALMQFLQEKGVKSAYAARIFKTYGTEALPLLQANPYQLAQDLPRIGFQIADAIARRSDLPVDDAERARACLAYLLESALEEGHMFIARDELLERCGTDFELDYHILAEALDHLAAGRRIQVESEAPGAPVYLWPLYRAEADIAGRLAAAHTIAPPSPAVDCDAVAEAVVRRLAIALSESQRAIVQGILSRRLAIVTGGPGTGKTTLIRSLAVLFENQGCRCLLAAPTGRAARRLAEVTGRPAATLHKLLGYNLAEGRFERDADNPLETEAVIVDEASMVDVLLMAQLIRAMPLAARLVLVGDVSQLPSVGPGTVLADLIASGKFATFELTEIFRQAAQSPIIVAAHEVRHGRMPGLRAAAPGEPLSGFTFLEIDDPAAIVPAVLDLCRRDIPQQLGLDGRRDVQVLSPMHKGVVGTLNLNARLQETLNPGTGGLAGVGATFRPGDKVMQLRNNYQKEVFNGEIGLVAGIDSAAGRLSVAYDGREVPYEAGDLDELTLAYAISVHKSQGSEYPLIIVPMVTQHYIMLQRNLLYTALTRAQCAAILIGSAKAVRIAVETDTPRRRRSLLAWRLGSPLPGQG